MPIHRLLYRSDVSLFGADAEILQQVAEIADCAAARNAASGLSGALLTARGVFIQALEGPLPALETTFERICCDLRHRRVELLEFTQVDAPMFAEWSMVQVPANSTDERLCASLALLSERALDQGSAQATVQLMRALLLTHGVTTAREANGPARPVALP